MTTSRLARATRITFLIMTTSVVLAGCASTQMSRLNTRPEPAVRVADARDRVQVEYVEPLDAPLEEGSSDLSYPSAYAAFDPETIYGPVSDEGFEIPAVRLSKVDPAYYRTVVDYQTDEAPGTIIVDTATKHLYFVLEDGRALRYGVGIGKEGFAWQGRAVIERKQAWPRWFPPAEMIERRPELAEYSADNGGMGPALDNPLGARALYIYQNGQDTLYRIHGSPEYWTIGTAASSGCVRMINQDVIDLFDRVPEGTPIVVL